MTRATSIKQIQPLLEMCKAGRLYDADKWLQDGSPVNPPHPEKARKYQSPLRFAIDRGFHSLVELLLTHDAEIDNPRWNPLSDAIFKRRLDIIELLVQQGTDIHSVSMHTVFDCRQPEIIEYFIEIAPGIPRME